MSQIERFLNKVIAEGRIPGAVFLAAQEKRIEQFGSVGYARLEPERERMTTDHIFDVASLTKPLVAAVAAMILVEEAKLHLDAPISLWFPEYSAKEKAGVTVKHLLTHTSGLPAWRPVYIYAGDRDEAIRYICSLPLECEPGAKVEYSCPGYILLSEIVRRESGVSFKDFCTKRILKPLQANETFFDVPGALLPRVVPTEKDSLTERRMSGDEAKGYAKWRTGIIHGTPHDGNAHFLQGESGNAGLFSTARDLFRFARMIFSLGQLEGRRVLNHRSIRQMVRNHTQGLNQGRGLGWKKAEGAGIGDLFSDGAFGHNGFTGCSMWLDPEDEIVMILLTNRLHPTPDPRGIMDIRARFHNLALTQL